MIRRLWAGLRLNIRLTALSVSSPRDRGFSGALDCEGLSDIAALYHGGDASGIIQLIGIDGSSYPSKAQLGVSASPAAAPSRARPIAGDDSCLKHSKSLSRRSARGGGA
jgi:hypothetical protein